MSYTGPERRRGGPDRRNADGERTKILIVDDHALFRVGIANILGREPDFDVVGEADDSRSAVDRALETSPDIILMDLSLPVINGWEATRRIKANAALRAIPIIALSAHAMTGDEEKALQSGCDDYLSKPLDEALLFAKLARFLGQS